MIDKPYYRIARPGPEGGFKLSGCSAYTRHPEFAPGARTLVRGYQILERDLHALFEYVEPDDTNASTYSLRTHALLVRACIEVEANATATLRAGKFSKDHKRWNIRSAYSRLEHSHHLSSFEVKVPHWKGTQGVRRPFECWGGLRAGTGYQVLPWYQAYNDTKHDRANSFSRASLSSVVDAVAGCLVLITAQHLDETYSGKSRRLVMTTGDEDGWEAGVGPELRIRMPSDFSESERYSFDGNKWRELAKGPTPFQAFDYDALPES